MNELPLQGRTVAVPETRELDVFTDLLSRRGAEVLRCPLVAIRDAPDAAAVLEWIRQFNAGSCDDLVLLTGEGLRRLLACIDRHAPDLRANFVARLAQVRKITRGPKPARALRELGLESDLAAAEPTTAGVIAALRPLELRGRRFGVQLYGSEPNLPLREFLTQAGASVSAVAPYVYADAADDAQVQALVERMATGGVDAIAFTSMAQVQRLFTLADRNGTVALLQKALRATVVAAVGPVVRDELLRHGITAALVPGDRYFLKPLTQLLSDTLGPKG